MDANDYLKLLRRRWWVLLIVLALSLGAAYATLPNGRSADVPVATSYTATHTLLQSPDAAAPINFSLTQLFAKTGEVPRKAAVRLGRPAQDGPALAAMVNVTTDPDVGSMRVSVTSKDGEEAARVANAFAEEVKAFLLDGAVVSRRTESATLQVELDQLQAQLLEAQDRASANARTRPIYEAQISAYQSRYQAAFERLQVLQSEGAASSPLQTLEQATPVPILAGSSPVPTTRAGRLGLAGVLGLVLGIALLLGLERLDTRVRDRQVVEDVSTLAVVAEVPRLDRKSRKAPHVVVAADPVGAAAEAYRALRSSLLLIPSRPVDLGLSAPQPYDLTDWESPRVLLVTSPGPGDGKTSTTVNLAATLAEAGQTVLVLDADFRKSMAHRYLGVPRSVGLADVLSDGARTRLRDIVQETSVPGVSLITSGSSSRHPAALLARVGSVIDEAASLADVVIIDSAPLLVANDATDIVPYVDSVLVVARAAKTTRPELERTSEVLARLGVPVLGIVLQASRETSDKLAYYSDDDGIRPFGSSAAARAAARSANGRAGLADTRSDDPPAATDGARTPSGRSPEPAGPATPRSALGSYSSQVSVAALEAPPSPTDLPSDPTGHPR